MTTSKQSSRPMKIEALKDVIAQVESLAKSYGPDSETQIREVFIRNEITADITLRVESAQGVVSNIKPSFIAKVGKSVAINPQTPDPVVKPTTQVPVTKPTVPPTTTKPATPPASSTTPAKPEAQKEGGAK